MFRPAFFPPGSSRSDGLHILPHLPCCGIPELLSSRSFREAVPPDPESRPFPSGQVPQLAHPVQVPLDAWQESLRSPHAFSALLRVQMETDDNISPGIRLTAMPLLPVPRILLLKAPGSLDQSRHHLIHPLQITDIQDTGTPVRPACGAASYRILLHKYFFLHRAAFLRLLSSIRSDAGSEWIFLNRYVQ